MIICKQLKNKLRARNINNIFEYQMKIIQIEYPELKIFFHFILHVKGYMQKSI